MIRPGALFPRTARALLCFLGIAWLVVAQIPAPVDAGDPIAPNAADFLARAVAETTVADDFSSALEDSIELVHVDLHGRCSAIKQIASPSEAPSRNGLIVRVELSSPLLV
jgi:hypothetical protein